MIYLPNKTLVLGNRVLQWTYTDLFINEPRYWGYLHYDSWLISRVAKKCIWNEWADANPRVIFVYFFSDLNWDIAIFLSGTNQSKSFVLAKFDFSLCGRSVWAWSSSSSLYSLLIYYEHYREKVSQPKIPSFLELIPKRVNYRIRSYTAPRLNTTSPFSKVLFLGVFLNRTPFFGQKVHSLRDFFNWTSPKNQYWKIEPRGCKRTDTVYTSITKVFIIQISVLFGSNCLGFSVEH